MIFSALTHRIKMDIIILPTHEKEDFMKLNGIISTIKNDLLSGKFGKSGQQFLTANELMEKYQVSFVSALKILNALIEKNLLISIGNKKYIMNGLYSHNCDLQKLASKKIGILLQDITNPFFAKVVELCNNMIIKNGFSPILKLITPENEIQTLITLIHEGCSGVISFCQNQLPEILDIYQRFPLPVVFINTEIPIDNCNVVNSDNYASGQKAAKHLIDYGYDSLYLCNAEQNFGDPRFQGFIDYVKSCNLPFDESRLIVFEFNAFSTNPIVLAIKKDPAKRIGIFCFHDLIAENLLNLFNFNNIKVPEKVGIIGYDQLDTIIPLFAQLTTFTYSFENIAKSAVNLLIENITNLKLTKNIIEEPTIFLVRNTTSKMP